MPVMIVDGERKTVPTLFVSQAVYAACYEERRPWSSDQYLFVEIAGLLPAWITNVEKVRLDELTTDEAFQAFTAELRLCPMRAEDFRAWQSGTFPTAVKQES